MSPYKGKSIFIQIASYRDPELKPTLKDLFDKADEPNTLHVCVCWQHREEDDWDDLDIDSLNYDDYSWENYHMLDFDYWEKINSNIKTNNK